MTCTTLYGLFLSRYESKNNKYIIVTMFFISYTERGLHAYDSSTKILQKASAEEAVDSNLLSDRVMSEHLIRR